MAWTDPKTMGHEPTLYSDWNTYVRDNTNYLKTAAVSAQIFLSAAGMNPQATTGCEALATTSLATNGQDIRTLDFDAAAIEYAQSVLFAMPSDYNGGTFTYKILWMHADTTTDFSVVWAVEAICYADDGALDAAWGTAVNVTDTGGTTNDIYVSPISGAVTPGGAPAAGSPIIVRVQRVATDAADTLAIDAGLIGIQITYTRQ